MPLYKCNMSFVISLHVSVYLFKSNRKIYIWKGFLQPITSYRVRHFENKKSLESKKLRSVFATSNLFINKMSLVNKWMSLSCST